MQGKGKMAFKKGVHRKPEKVFSFNEADARLYDLFRHHEFEDFPHPLRHRLVEFYQLLMSHQKTDNVTRLIRFRDIGIKHFIDSLMVPRLTTLSFPLLDKGTGPGFPGIPLKICYPEERVILAEGVRKRVDFLKAVREEMNLKNLDIVGRKVDDQFELPVQGVITRAVETAAATLKSVGMCLQPGGKVFLMKGPNVDHEILEVKETFGKAYRLIEDHAYSLPKTPHQRRLLVYQRAEETPS
jgi:16S rRNA (guanine527-N7)-methyltransferase